MQNPKDSNARLVPLNSKEHSNIRFNEQLVFYTGPHLYRLYAVEVIYMSNVYPLFFTKNSENGDFELVAAAGFENDCNCIIGTDLWDQPYIPRTACLSAISLKPDSDINKEPHDYLLDLESPVIVSENEGELIYDEEGKPTELLRMLKQIELENTKFQLETRAFLHELAEQDLLSKCTVSLKFSDGNTRRMTGIWTIGQDAMAGSKVTAHLHKKGYLGSAFAIAMSLSQFEVLRRRHNRKYDNKIESVSYTYG